MEEIIRLDNRYYILSSSPRVDDRVCVLKHGDTFGVFDRHGDIQPIGKGDQGLYHHGTRHLSLMHLQINGVRPFLLGSSITPNNLLLNSDMTNPDLSDGNEIQLQRGSLHLFRTQFIWNGTLCNRFRLTNVALEPADITLSLHVAADFADIFEARGHPRAERGIVGDPAVTPTDLIFTYDGLDQQRRRTRMSCDPPPAVLTAKHIEFATRLHPKEEAVFSVCIHCQTREVTLEPASYDTLLAQATRASQEEKDIEASLHTSNEAMNEWLNRSIADLHTMITSTPHGLYPYAGIPWFSTPFGRDGIIAALEVLAWAPDVAKGVLRFLAHYQAAELIPEQDAEPGKILHEMREGEMAALQEIPFGLYYGSVDSTPLFIILAGAYYERSGDHGFLQTLWPNIERALAWIDRYGDFDGDGFVEYMRRNGGGLLQQGWKDSHDSVFHADGTIAEGPIALCEVQGYVYWAKNYAAILAEVLGIKNTAATLRQEAEQLRARFQNAFWCDDLGTFALALDANKRPCRVRSSNAGHCLLAGIASQEQAQQVAHTLLEESSFSGWGIRTIDAREVRYNPMSYHNGSVWPHDNALIAAGFWRYGLRKEAQQVFNGLFDLSKQVDQQRLPELICGFHRREHQAPTIYPTACAPQAWAAAAPLFLLSTMLGISMKPDQQEPAFTRPMLPPVIDFLSVRNLSWGPHQWSLFLRGKEGHLSVQTAHEKPTTQTVVP